MSWKERRRKKEKISASVDGGPRYRVCGSKTLQCFLNCRIRGTELPEIYLVLSRKGKVISKSLPLSTQSVQSITKGSIILGYIQFPGELNL